MSKNISDHAAVGYFICLYEEILVYSEFIFALKLKQF